MKRLRRLLLPGLCRTYCFIAHFVVVAFELAGKMSNVPESPTGAMAHFHRQGGNHKRCQQCQFNNGGYECSIQTPCVVCESWLPENWNVHEEAKSQKLKEKSHSSVQKVAGSNGR